MFDAGQNEYFQPKIHHKLVVQAPPQSSDQFTQNEKCVKEKILWIPESLIRQIVFSSTTDR